MVDGATALAQKYKVSDLAIGLTIVAFGTSAPELVVNTMASYQGHDDIVLGNIIGSNHFNLFIILGIAGLIYPMTVKSSTVWREIPISIIAAIFLYLLANLNFTNHTHHIARLEGMILLSCFIGFMYYVFIQMKTDVEVVGKHIESSNIKIVLRIILGLTGLILGGKWVVDHSIVIATELGMSEKIIGMTIIAAGTSLPELITSIVAALKKKSDIAIGNVIGSNIFNIFLILGVSAVIHPISYNPLFNLDIVFLCMGSLFLFIAMFTGKKKKLDRWESAVLITAYIIYTLYIIFVEG
ncbi:calcium/sodium antiporter [Membranihabitans marinus]